MRQNEQKTDPPYQSRSIIGPLAFLILFILFVYGSLLVGMLGAARWLIESQNLSFFLNLDTVGIVLMMLCLFTAWFAIVLIGAGIPYLWLRRLGHYRCADKTALIIILVLFHIFSAPFILWRMVRHNSRYLSRRHHQKLRRMVMDSRIMRERRLERKNMLKAKGNG